MVLHPSYSQCTYPDASLMQYHRITKSLDRSLDRYHYSTGSEEGRLKTKNVALDLGTHKAAAHAAIDHQTTIQTLTRAALKLFLLLPRDEQSDAVEGEEKQDDFEELKRRSRKAR